jgi:hypothetical protein
MARKPTERLVRMSWLRYLLAESYSPDLPKRTVGYLEDIIAVMIA